MRTTVRLALGPSCLLLALGLGQGACTDAAKPGPAAPATVQPPAPTGPSTPPLAPTVAKSAAPRVVASGEDRAPEPTIDARSPVVATVVTPRKPNGKPAKFKWTHGLCDNAGTFDTGRFRAEELAGTVELFQTDYVPAIDQRTTQEALDKEFRAAFDRLKALVIVPEPVWETYRATKLTQFQQRYLLGASEIAARKEPGRLAGHASYAACRRWADPLIAGDDDSVLAGWRALAAELGAKPGASASWREVEAVSREPGAATRARAELLSFGWHNCVNELTVPLQIDERDFEKLLTKVTHDCDH